ncbi:MAG: hypothetical protein K1W41_07415 [Lachnospiraceae bacterium]
MNITFENIQLSPYPMEQIQYFTVSRGINRHDSAIIQGIMDEASLQMYQYMMDSGTCVTLHAFCGDEKQLLFSGFMDMMESHELTGACEVTIRLSGLTKALDRVPLVWDYQSVKKTNLGMVRDIMSGYADISYEEACAETVIPQFLLQYEESDYMFLKRVLSMEKQPVFTAMRGAEGSICFGKEDMSDESVESFTQYEIVFDQCLLYRAESEAFHDIGEKIRAFGRTLRVREASYSLADGISRNSYVLCDERDFGVERIYNKELTGISLDGTIQDRKRDKVQVELDMTPETGEDSRRWFGYSSVASSADGSGWYCMPEKEEEIRLYCPTADEAEAYIISAIRKDGQGTQGSASGDEQDPINKSLSNVQGQQVHFTPEGVSLFCADGAAVVNLTKEGEIMISAQDDIALTSDHDVSMRAENGISVMANGSVILTNDNGAVYDMASNIRLEANRIKNNC